MSISDRGSKPADRSSCSEGSASPSGRASKELYSTAQRIQRAYHPVVNFFFSGEVHQTGSAFAALYGSSSSARRHALILNLLDLVDDGTHPGGPLSSAVELEYRSGSA